jgi:hypothetical protein
MTDTTEKVNSKRQLTAEKLLMATGSSWPKADDPGWT